MAGLSWWSRKISYLFSAEYLRPIRLDWFKKKWNLVEFWGFSFLKSSRLGSGFNKNGDVYCSYRSLRISMPLAVLSIGWLTFISIDMLEQWNGKVFDYRPLLFGIVAVDIAYSFTEILRLSSVSLLIFLLLGNKNVVFSMFFVILWSFQVTIVGWLSFNARVHLSLL